MQSDSGGTSLLVVFLAVAAVAAFWCVVVAFIGWLSGWRALTRRFRSDAQPYGDVRTAGPFFHSVYWRLWSHYSNVVRMTASEDGFYLSVLFFFRIGHPPLRIPWDEIEMRWTRFFFFRYLELKLGKEERIPFRMRPRTAKALGLDQRVLETGIQ